MLPASWGRTVQPLAAPALQAPVLRDENASGNGDPLCVGYVETRDVLRFHYRSMRGFQVPGQCDIFD